MGRACFIIAVVVLLGYAAQALEDKASKQAAFVDGVDGSEDDEYDDYDYPLQDKVGHKHKHKHKLLSRNAGFSTAHINPFAGALKSLVVFIAIKIKIILVVITVIGIIGFTLKVFGALKYAGYIGGGCPVIHEPAYGLGYSATPPPEHHHDDYGSYGPSNEWSSTATSYARNLVENYVDTESIAHALHSFDIAQMVFSSLEMEEEECRRRLVCELDAKARQLPMLGYAINYFSHGFERYRATSGEKVNFNECAKIYSGCNDYGGTRGSRKKKLSKTADRNNTST